MLLFYRPLPLLSPLVWQWYESANTIGGTVSGNTVAGAAINLNVDGGGTADAPVVVTDNALSR